MRTTKKEMQTIEFKQLWCDEYREWICGFVNAQGGMLVGTGDDGRMVGVVDETE